MKEGEKQRHNCRIQNEKLKKQKSPEAVLQDKGKKEGTQEQSRREGRQIKRGSEKPDKIVRLLGKLKGELRGR